MSPRRRASDHPRCAIRRVTNDNATTRTARSRPGWLPDAESPRPFSWVATIYVIRLLAPEDYGIVAIATVLFGLLIRLCDAGFGNAVVVSEDTDKRTLQEFFGFLLIISIGLALLHLLAHRCWLRFSKSRESFRSSRFCLWVSFLPLSRSSLRRF